MTFDTTHGNIVILFFIDLFLYSDSSAELNKVI